MSNQAKARRIAVLGTRAVGKFLSKEKEKEREIKRVNTYIFFITQCIRSSKK